MGEVGLVALCPGWTHTDHVSFAHRTQDVCLLCLEVLTIHGISFLSYNQAYLTINTLRPRQNGRHFPDDILE